ncbi:hypothetical protein AAG570_004510 [Ranatra chinensis]|uniref:Major facilitator superfamily associated domain-containing protein n=1 Tax=Ranatra chinensis TaxID=642074 RepID=A0ABD0YDQ0_9HEMI
MKAHYFLYNAGTAPVWPFVATLAKQLGFSSLVVGTVNTLLPVIGVFVKPGAGALADRFQCRRALFVTFIAITVAAFIGIPWIPPLPTDSRAEVHCDALTFIKLPNPDNADACLPERFKAETGGDRKATIDCQMECMGDAAFIRSVCTTWHQNQYCASVRHPMASFHLSTAKIFANESLPDVPETTIISTPQVITFIAQLLPAKTLLEANHTFIEVQRVGFNGHWQVPYCKMLSIASCNMTCQNALLTEISTSSKIKNSEVTFLYQFWLLFIFMTFGYIGMAIVVSLGDAICFDLLGDRPSEYGNQRLWGSVGWGTFSIFAGLLLDEFSKGQAKKNYIPAFILMFIILVLDFLVSLKIQNKQSKHSPSIVRDIGKLLSESRILIFALWCICAGICQALTWVFLFWYLEDMASLQGCQTQQWMKTLEGLVMGLQCLVGELPCFFFSGWILKKIGHVNAMTLVLLSTGLRFLIYAVLVNPWWSLIIECINGFTFGIFYSTMTSYASIVAPPGTEATVQGLVGALFEGVGVSIGSFLAGLAFDNMEGSSVFCIFGIGALVCCFLHSIIQYIIHKRSPPLPTSNEGNSIYLKNESAIIFLLLQFPNLIYKCRTKFFKTRLIIIN